MSDKLTLAEVEHIAELAKLGLTAQEVALFQEQLSEILQYAEMLHQVPTDDIPPTAQVITYGDMLCHMREDRVEPSLTQDQALANAPAQRDGQFQVHPILDE